MATLHDINHDAGGNPTDFWDSETDPSAAISVGAAGGLNSTANGLIFDLTVSDTQRVDSVFTPPGSNEYRYRSYFDPNGNTTFDAGGQLAWGVEEAGGVVMIGFAYSVSGSNLRIIAQYGTDSGQTTFSTIPTVTDAPHCVEMRIKRAANSSSGDGEATWYLDGIEQDAVTGIDNFNTYSNTDAVYAENANVGAADFYFDEIFITDDADTALGCAPAVFSGYDLVIGGGQP
jgi:hypothetical protein